MVVIDIAESYIGCSVSKDRGRYLALVRGPTETLSESYFAAPETSGCALVVRGLWRLSGLDHPILAMPYRIGHAVSDVIEIARTFGAWHPAPLGSRRPEVGDVVVIGGPEHVLTVTAVDGDWYTSVDGGQRDDKGQQAIAARVRRWHAGKLDGRPVLGTISASSLPFPSPSSGGDGWVAAARDAIAPVKAAAHVVAGAVLGGGGHELPARPNADVCGHVLPTIGIDVSHYQPHIDWPRVVSDPQTIRFASLKATDGIGSPDASFDEHVRGAKSVDLDVGAYHFLRVRTGPQDAAAQAREFMARCRNRGLTMRPWLDVEPTSSDPSGPAYLDAIRAFGDVVAAELGAPPILYTYPAFWTSLPDLTSAADLAAWPLWIASYTVTMPRAPAPWGEFIGWQYAAGAGVVGHVDGVPGACDLDRLLVPLDAVRI